MESGGKESGGKKCGGKKRSKEEEKAENEQSGVGDSLRTFHQVTMHLCVETELLSGSPQGESKGT